MDDEHQGTLGEKTLEPMNYRSQDLEGSLPGGTRRPRSPQEIRQRTRDATAKIVAAAAGAMEGYAENTDPELIGRAARKAAEGLRESARAVKEELKPADSPSGQESSSIWGERGEGKGSIASGVADQVEGIKEKASEVKDKAGEAATSYVSKARERLTDKVQQLKTSAKSKTPEEVRQEVKETVGRPLAAATGALEGFVDQEDPKIMADAARKATRSIKEAVSGLKDGARGNESPTLSEPVDSY